jgi:hypothetical protein
MPRGKFLYSTKIKDYITSRGDQIEFSVYGVFDTTKVLWDYYVISHVNNKLTSDLCNLHLMNVDSITTSNVRCGRKFETKEKGIEFIQDFKIKWETGSNDSKSELRDKKINEIIN